MSAGTVKLTINGVDIECREGSTILEAATASGIEIPTLCNLEGLTPYGGCRLCLVEISGTAKLFPACTTPAASGMNVTTNSPKLYEYRKWQSKPSSPNVPIYARYAWPTTTVNSKH
jgi:bidirectional [NiFe] hydrogenase diaphorase subunit